MRVLLGYESWVFYSFCGVLVSFWDELIVLLGLGFSSGCVWWCEPVVLEDSCLYGGHSCVFWR